MKLIQKFKPFKTILFLFILSFTHPTLSEKLNQPITKGHITDTKVKNIDLLDPSTQHLIQQQDDDGNANQLCYTWECLKCASPNIEKTYPWQNKDKLINCSDVEAPQCTLDSKTDCNTDSATHMSTP